MQGALEILKIISNKLAILGFTNSEKVTFWTKTINKKTRELDKPTNTNILSNEINCK